MADDPFLKMYAPLANDIAHKTRLDPSVVLGIIDTETGHGQHLIGNNLFGISPGGRVAQYPDAQTATDAFITLMNSPRYAGVAAAPTPAAQAAALVKSGYNTVNPNYAGLVSSKAQAFGKALGYQEEAPPATATAPAAAAPAASSQFDQLIGGANNTPPAGPQPTAATAPVTPPSAFDQLITTADKATQSPLAGVPAKPADQPKPDTTTPLDEFGAPVGRALPEQAVGNRVIDAAVQGYRNTEPTLTPEGEAAVNQWSPAGLPLGSAIVSPALKAVDAVRGGVNALTGAGMQGVVEGADAAGVPRLGRDINMLTQVAPVAGIPGMAGPAPITAAGLDAAAAGPRVPYPTSAPEGRYASGVGPLSPEFRPQAETIPVGPTSEVPPAPPEAAPGGPVVGRGGAAGADVTTAPIPEKTRGQAIRDLDSDVAQTVYDRAGPALRDDNVYFEGIPPRPEAYRDFNPQKALDHKTFYNTDTEYRQQIDAINKERNDGMSDRLKEHSGDGISLEAAEDARREVTPAKLGVFDGEKAVDPELLDSFRAKLQDTIDGPLGKRSGVRGILQNVYGSLFDKAGEIETMPSRLQGVRDNMTDWLSKGKGTDAAAKDVQAARSVLTDLVEDLNPVMQSGAPKWDTFRQEWQRLSQPVNQQTFLQQYRPGTTKSLWDAKGDLVPRKVQGLLNDIATAKRKPISDANSLTPEQIQDIVNVRNELATKEFARTQADVAASPTVQLMSNAAKRGAGPVGVAVRAAADYAVHAGGVAAAAAGVPGINAAMGMWQASRPARAAAKVARQNAAAAAQVDALKRNLLSQGPPENRLTGQ
jgi:hypothetical protein